MLKVAVIGLGDVSHVHLPVIQENSYAVLTAVCDIDDSQQHAWAKAGIKFYTDYLEMLEEEQLDCVHICLPHYLHYQVAKTCVEKGIHVFLEKPLDKDLVTSIKLLELEEQNKHVKICISFQNRYNETVEKLREIIENGDYGQVTGMKGLVAWYRPKSYYNQKPWRGEMAKAGGGVMINQAIHTLDLMQLIGGGIVSIRGSVDQMLDYGIEVEDTATAKIQFANGARGLFFATNSNTANSSVELQVLLEKGEFTIKDSVLIQVSNDGQKKEIIEDARLPGEKFYYGASHAKLINHFYSCIEKNRDDYIHVKDGITAMKMIEVIRQSSDRKQEIEMESSDVKSVL